MQYNHLSLPPNRQGRPGNCHRDSANVLPPRSVYLQTQSRALTPKDSNNRSVASPLPVTTSGLQSIASPLQRTQSKKLTAEEYRRLENVRRLDTAVEDYISSQHYTDKYTPQQTSLAEPAEQTPDHQTDVRQLLAAQWSCKSPTDTKTVLHPRRLPPNSLHRELVDKSLQEI